ncbi:MAG: ComEA family DNA-binding protein [Pirellula sp.]|jgi:competence protein ComEA
MKIQEDCDWEARAMSVMKSRGRALGWLAMASIVGAVLYVNIAPSSGVRNEDLATPFVLDLNRASEAELNLLPGVGPKMVRSILDHRQTRGGFDSVEDLMEVPGIKEGRLRQLAPYVRVGQNSASGIHSDWSTKK